MRTFELAKEIEKDAFRLLTTKSLRGIKTQTFGFCAFQAKEERQSKVKLLLL